MAIIQGNAHKSSVTGFYPKTINGSLRFNDDDSAYLSFTPTGTSGGRTKFTYSGWVKLGTLSTSNGFHLLNAPYASNLNGSLLQIDSNDEFYAQFRVYTTGSQGTFDAECYSNMKFRDPSAWYHIVFAYDSTDSTPANRMKLWVNGVSQTFRSQDNPGSSTAQYLGSEFNHYIGRWLGTSHGNTDGYMAEVFFIDGTAYTASDFGETKNGVWVPKNVTATDFTMGTNGFYLNFQDDATVEAFNTAIWAGDDYDRREITGIGFQPDLVWVKRRNGETNGSDHMILDSVRGVCHYNALSSNGTYEEGRTAAGSSWVNFGDIARLTSDGFIVKENGDASHTLEGINQSGGTYVAWCWDAGANNASTGHSSVIYEGNAGDKPQDIAGFGFDPDLIWTKARSGTYSGRDHALYDSVRGADKYLESSTPDLEATTAGAAFIDGGYRVGTVYHSNGPGTEYVAWGWEAGGRSDIYNINGTGYSTASAAGLDGGSVNPTGASVSTTNGFSIVAFTDPNNSSKYTVEHGLGATPNLVIVKDRTNGSSNWIVSHSSLTNQSTYYVLLNGTAEDDTFTEFWGDGHTSQYIGMKSGVGVLGGADCIAYCWAEKTGYSKFGSYTGSTGNVTVNDVGFRPGFLLVKNIDSATSKWGIVDGTRSPFNDTEASLYASSNGAEYTGNLHHIEFTNEGFIVKNTDDIWNTNGDKFIYAAFKGSYSDYITDYNTDGSIDSRVKASDTTGFSICSYVGNGSSSQNFGHGLSSAPDWVIIKDRTEGVQSWTVWHTSLGTSKYLNLNSNNGVATDSNRFPSDPSPSVVNIGSSQATNKSGNNYIAYCWTQKSGLSAFGTYSGNGSSTGPIIYTTDDGTAGGANGFKPALIIHKRISDSVGTPKSSDWWLQDNTRTVANGNENTLFANGIFDEWTDADGGGFAVDFLDNGFQLKDTSTVFNTSGDIYIYAAFADTREAAFWLDQSTNNNDWQPVNLDHSDTLLDSPTDNFATLNPLAPYSGSTYSEGNLKVSTGSTQYGPVISTIAVSSGKYYCEMTERSTGVFYTVFGAYSTTKAISTTTGLDSSGVGSFGYKRNSGNITIDGSETAYGDTWTTGDVIGMALNLDDNEVTFYKNGTSQGTRSITAGEYYVAVSDNDGGGSCTVEINFGQQPFKYGPPA